MERTTPDLAASAAASIIEQNRAKLNWIAWRILRNREDAEDAVSLATVKVLSHLGDFRGDSLFGWVASTVRNAAIDMLRQRSRRPQVQSIDAPPHSRVRDRGWGSVAISVAPHTIVEPSPVSAALDQLGAEKRAAVEMWADGSSHREIAGALSISEIAAKVRVCRAKKEIAAAMYRVELRVAKPKVMRAVA